jgi:hypothetical protein
MSTGHTEIPLWVKIILWPWKWRSKALEWAAIGLSIPLVIVLLVFAFVFSTMSLFVVILAGLLAILLTGMAIWTFLAIQWVDQNDEWRK